MTIRSVRVQSRKALNAETAALSFVDEVQAALDRRLPQPSPPAPDLPVEDGPVPPGLQVDGESPQSPDWVLFQAYIAHQLRIARHRLMVAAEERDQEVHDNPKVRDARDEAVREAYDQLVRARQAVRATVGEAQALAILGVEGATPVQHDALLESLRVAAARLRKTKSGEVDELLPGISPDWDELAVHLDTAAERLEVALRDWNLGRRDAYRALRKRERVHDEIRDLVVGFTRMLDGLYRVAGRQDLGDRIRLPLPHSTAGEDADGDEPEVVPPVPEPVDPIPDPTPPADGGDGPQVLPIVAVVPDGETGEEVLT